MIFCYFLFLLVLLFLVFFNVHYVMLLLLLEIMLLSVFLFLSWHYLVNFGLVGMFLFLLVMVCMGGFSISLLVSLSRFFGRDFWFFRYIF